MPGDGPLVETAGQIRQRPAETAMTKQTRARLRRRAIFVAACLALVVGPAFSPPRSRAALAQTGTACGANPSPPDSTDPSVVVTAPASGAVVGSPLQVRGLARVFEASVSLALKDAAGVSISDDTTQAAIAAPALAPFSARLPFAVAKPIPACLWVYEVSARDGHAINVVQVPLTLLPATGTVAVAYPAGWNLVAAPEGTIITGTSTPLYTLPAGSLNYLPIVTAGPLRAGTGYWVYFMPAATQSLPVGAPGSIHRTLPPARWVMIGNPGATPATVLGADIVYVYDPAHGYLPETALSPGQGAWAFSFAGGMMTIQSSAP